MSVVTQCPVCTQRRATNANGRVRRHRIPGQVTVCDGSGQWPHYVTVEEYDPTDGLPDELDIGMCGKPNCENEYIYKIGEDPNVCEDCDVWCRNCRTYHPRGRRCNKTPAQQAIAKSAAERRQRARKRQNTEKLRADGAS